MAGKVLGAVKVVRARPGVGRTPGNCPNTSDETVEKIR
jgi:hypothetical protein